MQEGEKLVPESQRKRRQTASSRFRHQAKGKTALQQQGVAPWKESTESQSLFQRQPGSLWRGGEGTEREGGWRWYESEKVHL